MRTERRLALVTFRERSFPSRRQMIYGYLACLFPIQTWSIYNLLHEVPAWLLQLNVWDLIAIVSYTQLFALLESIVVFVPLLLAAGLLPRRWFSDKFVAISTGVVFLSAAWFIVAHFNQAAVQSLGYWQLLPWLGLYLASQLVLFSLVQLSHRLEVAIGSFADRLAAVSALYFIIALLSVPVVVVRNVS